MLALVPPGSSGPRQMYLVPWSEEPVPESEWKRIPLPPPEAMRPLLATGVNSQPITPRIFSCPNCDCTSCRDQASHFGLRRWIHRCASADSSCCASTEWRELDRPAPPRESQPRGRKGARPAYPSAEKRGPSDARKLAVGDARFDEPWKDDGREFPFDCGSRPFWNGRAARVLTYKIRMHHARMSGRRKLQPLLHGPGSVR